MRLGYANTGGGHLQREGKKTEQFVATVGTSTPVPIFAVHIIL
jgi:hypothetical protein